ncbi:MULTISPECIES: DEAD/DEAH box helicase [Pseudomonadota]|uniref:DEAD/DEAH box helicase n=1 Tax=Pseudomonadota TaxID=1224 RepID=UPI00207B5752|nr:MULTISPECIES: DEAD/DEAH box helicase [Pseudomonadota]MDH5857824.1 DEAD/DEAH box helicase [Lampropedia aestuarii]
MSIKWDVSGKELRLIEQTGKIRAPSVDEIYAALVEGKPIEDGVPTSVVDLRVSRYPLVPRLVIEEGSEGIPKYSLTAKCRGLLLPLDLSDLDRGHVILGSTWYPIDSPTGTEVAKLLRDAGGELGPVQSLKSFLHVRKAAAAGGPVDDITATLSISPCAFVPTGDDTPSGVDANLYSYQLLGWRWLKFLLSEGSGGLLADEMGLGKTLQIIAALSDAGGGPLRPSLIVAPGSLLENWRREIGKFAPSLKVLKHHGPFRTGRPADLSEYDVVITSYDVVVGDNSLLNMIRWKVVVLDEAQFIRNPSAQRTKAVKHLQRDAGLAVTGTPIENRLLDVWSIMDFVYPGYLGDAKSFEKKFLNNADGATQLEPLISPLLLRRRVAEVAQDLPPRIDIPQLLELDESEAAAYDAERERIYAEYGSAATLVALTSLRRFCAHPSLMGGGVDTADPITFSKFRRLDEIVEEIFERGEKVLVFTSFTAMADIIARHIMKRFGAFAGVIDGRLPIEERQPMIDRFGSIKGSAALVLNPKAGGAGLNIVAANHVIHYNPEWNPALEDQASARAHRRGQDLPVTVHRLLIADTVEDVVNDRLTRKRTLSNAAIVGIEGKDEDYGDIVAALSRSPSKQERK